MSEKTIIEKAHDIRTWALDNYQAKKDEQTGYVFHDIMKHAEAILENLKYTDFYCPGCDGTTKPDAQGKCPKCGTKLPYYRAIGV